MILVDRALEQRAAEGNPVRVGVVGAGFAARGLVLQVLHATPGMDVVAVSNRTIETAEQAYRDAGVDDVVRVSSTAELEQAIAGGRHAVTDDPAFRIEWPVAEAIVSEKDASWPDFELEPAGDR